MVSATARPHIAEGFRPLAIEASKLEERLASGNKPKAREIRRLADWVLAAGSG